MTATLALDDPNLALYTCVFQKLAVAVNHQDLLACMAFACTGLGFDRFLYCQFSYDSFTQKHTDIISNYPDSFFNEEVMAIGIERNPLLVACKLTGDECVSNKMLIASEPAFKRATEAAHLSISWGLMVVHGFKTMAYFELSRAKGLTGFEELNSKRGIFKAIADAVERRRDTLRSQKRALDMSHKGVSRPLVFSVCPLSKRELDILRWTAGGKIAEEIAIILDLSPRTVSYHLANIMHQLGVPNKTAAVSKAQMYAWLY